MQNHIRQFDDRHLYLYATVVCSVADPVRFEPFLLESTPVPTKKFHKIINKSSKFNKCIFFYIYIFKIITNTF